MLSRTAVTCGKAFSKQAFGILPKIRELDRFMTSPLQEWVREAHPEVVFSVLGGAPMEHRKKTAEGKAEATPGAGRARA